MSHIVHRNADSVNRNEHKKYLRKQKALWREEASVLLSTHLIADIERVLDEVVFIREGVMVLHKDVDAIREETGKSVDTLFREVFAC